MMIMKGPADAFRGCHQPWPSR